MSRNDKPMDHNLKIAPTYHAKWLQIDKPKPFCDHKLDNLFKTILTGFNGWVPDYSNNVHDIFKEHALQWIKSSTLNKISGLDAFNFIDVCNGCTQFIDNLYMQGPVQVVNKDYKYHARLLNQNISDSRSLIPNMPLIIAMPFPSEGDIHPDMNFILNDCLHKNIDVHIDGAWLIACKDIEFDFSHPAIKSVGISFSKGLGLGWNRIALRFVKERKPDSISILNDFHMCNKMVTIIAEYVINNIPADYFWKTYGNLNQRVCNDFNLTPTKAFHVAKDSNNVLVGITPLVRRLIADEQYNIS